jgi:thymidylate synthase
MRSSDFHTHFVYDIWMALELLAYVADELGVPVGRFTFFSGSLHIYQKDADLGAF